MGNDEYITPGKQRMGDQERGPEAVVWATATDLHATPFERKRYFVVIRDGEAVHNLVITIGPGTAVHADRYVVPDYNYTIHDGCDHDNDDCVLDDPDFEENWYGPQPGTIYRDMRPALLQGGEELRHAL